MGLNINLGVVCIQKVSEATGEDDSMQRKKRREPKTDHEEFQNLKARKRKMSM